MAASSALDPDEIARPEIADPGRIHGHHRWITRSLCVLGENIPRGGSSSEARFCRRGSVEVDYRTTLPGTRSMWHLLTLPSGEKVVSTDLIRDNEFNIATCA